MKSPSRYVLYTRVSTAAQDDNFSHESQLHALQAHVLRHGGYVVETIRETASGESYVGRPGMQRAVAMLEADEADVLACYDVSRYSRDVEDQQKILRQILAAEKDLQFATIEFQRDAKGKLTPESFMMFGVSGNFAAYHKQKIADDCQRGRIEAVEQGLQTQRSVSPLGYKVLTKKDIATERYPGAVAGQYIVVESEAALVREIFRRRIEGESQVKIAQWLNEEFSKLGKQTSYVHTTIRNIIRNPLYRGEAHWGKVKRVRDDSRLERGYKRRFRYVDSSPNDIIKFAVPAIVSTAIFEAANETFNPGVATGESTVSYLLSGLLCCPFCGDSMLGASRGKGNRFYGCRKPRKYSRFGEKETCVNRLFPADTLDERVINGLRALCDDSEYLAQFLSKGSKIDAGLESLERQLEQIEAEEMVTVQAQIAGMRAGGSASAYEKILRQLAEQKSGVVRQIQAKKSNSVRGMDRQRIERTFDHVRHLLELPLLPHSKELQKVHNFLAVMFERIEFEDTSTPKFKDGRCAVSVGDVRLVLRDSA